MRAFRILLLHEFRQLLFSPASHVAAVIFLTLTGIFYWFIIEGYTIAPQKDLPSYSFFYFFWFFAFFVVPLLTMRSVAEERRSGTLESVLTTPTSALAVVLSKFLAIYGIYLGLWFLTLLFPLILVQFGDLTSARSVLFEPASTIGGLSFVALSGTFFIAIGVFASSLTRSQLVAAMVTVVTLFAVIAGSRLLETVSDDLAARLPALAAVVDYLQVYEHLIDFCQGVVDTRPVVYYLSNAGLLLGLATLVVKKKA